MLSETKKKKNQLYLTRVTCGTKVLIKATRTHSPIFKNQPHLLLLTVQAWWLSLPSLQQHSSPPVFDWLG